MKGGIRYKLKWKNAVNQWSDSDYITQDSETHTLESMCEKCPELNRK